MYLYVCICTMSNKYIFYYGINSRVCPRRNECTFLISSEFTDRLEANIIARKQS